MSLKVENVRKHRKKDWSFRSLFKVLTYTRDGLIYFFRYERSAIIYLIASVLCIGSGMILQMSLMEWIVILFILLTILALELVNTAIESICDLVCPEQHPLVKVAKDCGSAATGVLSLFAWIVATIIYFPKVVDLVKAMF